MKGIYIFLLLVSGFLGQFTIQAERYIIETGQFEKLKINGNFSVVYKNVADSTGYAFYESDTGNEDIFKFSTKGEGSLKVEPSDEKWGRSDLPVLHLYSDFLTSLESFSEQNVEVLDLAPCAAFSVTQVGNGSISVENIRSNNVSASITTGNGSIYLVGKCVNANFKMLGTGLISADELQADNVKCRILGTGSIGCWPVDNLSVAGLGSTKIYYKGSPNIKKTGGGKLFELPEADFTPTGTEVPTFSQSSQRTIKEYEEEEEDEDEDNDDDDDDDDDEEETYQTVVSKDD